MGTIEAQIRQKLVAKFSPVHMEVVNESYKHSVPKGSETHFMVLLVSEEFEGKSLIDQHKMVNATLKEEFATSIHALSIKTMTKSKWVASGQKIEHSTPKCLGGSKHDK